ncbi:MAG: HAMP domain-containing sensor histidine kinase, partial [Ramlibacter sp.]
MTTAASAAQRPDPEDVAYAGTVFWALRACEVLGALMFATVLPWWQPLVWWALVAGSGSGRTLYLHSAHFRAVAPSLRRWHYRWTIWLMMACVGSAAGFLYAPGNAVMHAVLGVYLLGSAALVALRTAGDLLRTGVAVCLVLLPTSLRFLAEGLQHGNTLLALLGVGGGLMAATIIFMSRLQERALMQQFEMRQRAERAADAVASVGLAKSRFFAAVSHDLRQPVHAIGLYLEPLVRLSEKARDQAARRAVEGISQSWRALDDLLSQVLDLTRMDSGVVRADVQPCEIAPLVSSLVMQHSAAAEQAGVRIVVMVPPDCYAMADDLMLMRVLSNLLDNAL